MRMQNILNTLARGNQETFAIALLRKVAEGTQLAIYSEDCDYKQYNPGTPHWEEYGHEWARENTPIDEVVHRYIGAPVGSYQVCYYDKIAPVGMSYEYEIVDNAEGKVRKDLEGSEQALKAVWTFAPVFLEAFGYMVRGYQPDAHQPTTSHGWTAYLLKGFDFNLALVKEFLAAYDSKEGLEELPKNARQASAMGLDPAWYA